MIEVEEAIARLLEETEVQTETLERDLLRSRDCIIAEDIYALKPVPHFPKSGMDGYAICSQDSVGASMSNPVKLQVIGEICAGDANVYSAKSGTAVRIMTGGRVPAGYDCVIKQEDTDYGENILTIYKAIIEWENYCKVGEDISAGQLVIQKYTRLTSYHIGILASLGYSQVRVLRPIRVGIISTGNELKKPGETLEDMQIYNSSSYTLAAQVEACGMEVVFMEICKDKAESFVEMIEERLDKVDIFLSTGAVSVGKKDIIPEALDQLGVTVIFRRVHMKPGTPVLVSKYHHKMILSLSGNPFAAMVNFQLFFWPVVSKMMNNDSYNWKRKKVVVREGNMKANSMRRFIRAYCDTNGVVLYTNNHLSSVLSNIADSNCLIEQKPSQEINPGDVVDILALKSNLY